VPFSEAARTWFAISLQTFGGPAGQIAVMQRTLVDEKRWIGQQRFLHALNYCMLLPGPEAQQLAIYTGWLLNGTPGGLVAGTPVLLVVGPPWLLWQAFRNPVTLLSSWWTSAPRTGDSASPPGAGLRVALIWAGWVVWAVLAALLAASVISVVAGRGLPRWRLPVPLHRLVFGLTGSAGVALVTTPATPAMASAPPHAAVAAQPQAGDAEDYEDAFAAGAELSHREAVTLVRGP
jgi:hypothetical protein